MPYIFQTLVFAYCVQTELGYTARDGNGRESGTIVCCAGRDGNGFQFDCNSREWIYRDGTGGTGYDFHSRVPLYCLAHSCTVLKAGGFHIKSNQINLFVSKPNKLN